MVYDVHVHLPTMGADYAENKRILQKCHEELEIDKFFVSGFYAIPNGNPAMTEELNAQVARLHRELPQIVEGYLYVNPRHEDCVERLRRAVEDDGFAGVKLWMATTCDDERVFPVAEAAIRYNIPILIHCFHKAVDQIYNETLGPHVANLARRYPEAKLIMAHLGGNPYHSIPAIRDCPNVWVDNSHSIFRADELRYTYERLGAGRILFGTDIPGNTWVKYGEVLELPVSEEERKDIFFRNAQRIFDRNYYVSGGKL